MLVKAIVLLWAVLAAVNCEPYPRFEFDGSVLFNNSFVNRRTIGVNNDALNCVTNNTDCCIDPEDGGWTDSADNTVQEGPSGDRDIYVTRGTGVVSLNRISGGSAGMWRCDILDSDGVMQSIYIYTGVLFASAPANGELYIWMISVLQMVI